jgi:hypothetical protein
VFKNRLLWMPIAVCLTMGSAIASDGAEAAIIKTDFQANLTTGSLAPQSFFGNFLYDDAAITGVGDETLDLSNGFLNLSFNFQGKIYTEKDDAVSPDFPQIVFKDGVLQGLDFGVYEALSFPNPVVIPGSVLSFVTTFAFPDTTSIFRVESSDSNNQISVSQGSITYSSQPIPTPALLPSLVGVGIGMWRKRRAEAEAEA